MHLKKHFFPMLAIALILIPMMAVVIATEAQEDVTARAYRTVNVRSGPSTSYPVIGQLAMETIVQVTGRSDNENNWLRINFEGRSGWVAYFTVSVEGNVNALPIFDAVPTTAGITIINTPTLSPPITDSTEQAVYVTSFRRVNVRSGPSTDYGRTGMLQAGQTAPITGRTADNQWLQIEIFGQQGWVAFFVVSVTGELSSIPVASVPTMTPSPTFTPAPTQIVPTPTPFVMILTTRFNTNLRVDPSFASAIAGVVPYNTTLEIEARTEDSAWLRVTYEGETGWLVSSLVNVSRRRLINRLPVATPEAEAEAE